MCVPGPCEGQKGASDQSSGTGVTGGGESITVWVLGIKFGSSARAASALNY